MVPKISIGVSKIFQHGKKNGCVQATFLYHNFSRFCGTLKANKFVSIDFQTHVFKSFLISMKFFARIINKKTEGEYKSSIAPKPVLDTELIIAVSILTA